MRYVAAAFGVEPGSMVAAGDSGNDLLMFDGGDHPVVLVGNMQPDVSGGEEGARRKLLGGRLGGRLGVRGGARGPGLERI